MILKNDFKVTLTTVDPLHIGGKAEPGSGAKKNPVASVNNKICIPGPSLKGALRYELERWLNNQYYDNDWPQDKLPLQPCIPATKFSEDERRLISEKHYREIGCHYPCDIKDDKYGGKCGRKPQDAHSICPVCYLLGAQGLVGFVNIPFLFSDTRYDELYSVRLNRVSRTAMEGSNRSYQLVPSGTKFMGILEVVLKDNLLGWELGKPRILKENTSGDLWLKNGNWAQENILKDFIKGRLENIGQLGGYRLKGFGKVKIEVT